ncbi:MFS transporter [Caulobacter sp. KR2-114]|uniref:MFS transporter n=1 Tax=Caulobacter sp. KR2-114 TaxID=3400912 RepID=UPI003C04DA2C
MTASAHAACDAAIARARAVTAAPKHPRLVLATTILASSLAFVDGSVVSVGLPAIGRALGADAADLQWVVNAYLLPLSALLLLGGALGDRYGERRMLIAGVAVFAVASAGCAWAPTLGWLLAARMLQGAGAALLMPNSLAILGAAFDGEARGQAVGAWAAAAAIAGAVAPLLGGWLIDGAGWRWIFLINLPVAAGAIALALAVVRDAAPGAATAPLDAGGAALASLALGALTWGLTLVSGPAGASGASLGLLALGALAGAGFVGLEARRGDRAMTPPALFASPSFIGLSLLTFLLYGALGGLMVLLPYVLIQAAHYSATAAGAALLPFPLVIAIASPPMGRLAGRIGGRLPLSIGPMVVAAGFLLGLRIGPQADYWREVLPAILLISIGMAGAVAPLTTAVLASVDARHAGSASGFNSAVARTGSLVVTALLGLALAAQGAALETAFRAAAVGGAALSLAAGACAWALVRDPPRAP